jgi:hypothetical protein
MKKVIIKNNWEDYEYYVGNTKINPKEIQVVCDKNGNEYNVVHKQETKSYNDMGHTYSATRIVLCVNHPLGEVILREKSEFYIK